MKILLFITALMGSALTAFAEDIKPDDPKIPLLQVFEPLPAKADKAQMTWDEKHPLLTVFVVSDLLLAKDQKGVLLGLNEKDTKAFAGLTQRFNGRLLILKTADDAFEVMHITAPIEDGYIGFKHPEAAAVAEYLRRRFRIAEFK